VLTAGYVHVGKAFSDRAIERLSGVLKSRGGRWERKLTGPEFAPEYEAAFIAWVRVEGVNQAKAILDTTKIDLRSLILRSRDEGWGQEKIGREIRKLIPSMSVARGRTIARTETHNAASYANQSATRMMASEVGLTLNKKWLAHPEPDRTRPTHLEAGKGEAIPMDEPYSVGGYSMMRPGDASMGAPAGEIINCRCGETEEVVDE
jgi:hypothetical protein